MAVRSHPRAASGSRHGLSHAAEAAVAMSRVLLVATEHSKPKSRNSTGSEITTSVAQGGSWFATRANGKLAGYLTAEIDQLSTALRIADMTAGSVGCAATSPSHGSFVV